MDVALCCPRVNDSQWWSYRPDAVISDLPFSNPRDLASSRPWTPPCYSFALEIIDKWIIMSKSCLLGTLHENGAKRKKKHHLPAGD